MESGKLNRRIQIQSQSIPDVDAFNQPLPASWSTIYTAWASIDIQNSQLLYSTAEFMDKITYRITMRWTSSVQISAKQRVIYTESTTGIVHNYIIEAVLNDQQGNKQLTLLCYALGVQE
jgi:SPP1 family predicted phage head-tail adaptor